MRKTSVVRFVLGAALAVSGGLEPARAQALESSDPMPAQVVNEDLRIEKTLPALQLSQPGSAVWTLRGGGSFQFFKEGESLAVMTAGDFAPPLGKWLGFTYTASFRDKVGIGPDVPLAPLHVAARGIDVSPLVLVENTLAPTVGRNLLRLSNNGPATFRFENQAAVSAGQPGAIWSFGQRALGNQFFIATAGAPSLNMTLDPNGNMTIAGSLAQMSDRNSKHEIEAVDGGQLLERVAALPLSTWSYKGDQARHLGPMAQDFAAAFGLGSDDKHVAPSDVAGVGLAAVQALLRQLDETNARLERLERALGQDGQEPGRRH